MSHLFAAPNQSGIITTSDQIAGAPVGNLLLDDPSDIWQTAGNTGIFIEYNLGQARAVDLIALLFTNAGQGDQWRIRAATSQANLTAAPLLDTGLKTMWASASAAGEILRHALDVLTAPVTAQWWRVDIATAETFFRAGILVISDNTWLITRGPAYGRGSGYPDNAQRTPTEGGSLVIRRRVKRPAANFDIRFISEPEREQKLRPFERDVAGDRGILYVDNPAGGDDFLHNRMIWGVASTTALPSNPSFGRFNVNFNIRGL